MNQVSEQTKISNARAEHGDSMSIRRQLLAYIVAGVFVLLVLFSITISWLAGKETSKLTINNAQQVARALAQQSVLALLTESEENASTALDQVMSFPDVSGAGLVTLDGEIFGWRGDARGEQYFRNFDWQNTRSYLILEEDESNWFVASAVILTDNDGNSETELFEATEEKLGYAILSFSKETLTQINRDIILTIAITGGIAVIGLILIVGGAIQRQLAPLQELSEVMAYNHETGEHKLAKVQGAKEVEQMANSFNAMMLTLDEQDERLRNQRDQLEAEVKIRTAELTVARDAALTSSRHKSEFLANMTHELRTPIQSIIGYVDLVKEEAENEGQFDMVTDLDKVTRNADRLLGMINCLLDLSKIEAGRMELNLSSTYLKDLLQDLSEATAPLFPRNNNKFLLDNHSDNPILRIDSEKLLQVLINLVSNACKFTERGTVTLRVENTHSEINFSVIDTGIGIPADQLAKIFDQFQQVDSGETRRFGGTGLGLAISKQFCELMGAKIKVESIEGEGSCFTVKLPMS
ncbi:sensor histidine kinase [Planctobacterium marinum]|uniref:histidine kinase n=1 Tax=Planctobacterium marinum TaxID=1631968 RepID=A0AA48HRS3_9ALTE|nr:hypothetical protein MACH26_23000 [Planctobacterium marinum]